MARRVLAAPLESKPIKDLEKEVHRIVAKSLTDLDG